MLTSNNTALFSKKQDIFLLDMADDLAKPSGGEKQRVGLARGLRNNVPIIILDEPTSALDPLSEKEIINQVNNFISKNDGYAGKVLLMTGHRLRTVKAADQIILLENGKIVESASCGVMGNAHDILVNNKKGCYAQYYHAQQDTPSFRFLPPTPPALPIQHNTANTAQYCQYSSSKIL